MKAELGAPRRCDAIDLLPTTFATWLKRERRGSATNARALRHARSTKFSTGVSFGHNLIEVVPRAIVAFPARAVERDQRMIVCVLSPSFRVR